MIFVTVGTHEQPFDRLLKWIEKMVEDKIIDEEYLKRVDETLEMIPLTFDVVFKGIFETNLDLLKDFLISVLNLKVDYESTKIHLSSSVKIWIKISFNSVKFSAVKAANHISPLVFSMSSL